MHNQPHSTETKKMIAAEVSASYTDEHKRAQSLRMKQLWASGWGKQMREALRERNRARRIYPPERARVLALKTYQHRHIQQGLCVECSNPICDLYARVHRRFPNRRCEECYHKRARRDAIRVVFGKHYRKRQAELEGPPADLLTGLVRIREW